MEVFLQDFAVVKQLPALGYGMRYSVKRDVYLQATSFSSAQSRIITLYCASGIYGMHN